MAKEKTIFIVDDDSTQSTMLKDHLSKFPAFTIHVFNTGEDCLKNLNLNPQIIFLDYNFDVGNAMNGIEILKKIKAENPEIEVIMLSGQDKIQVAVNSMKYKAFDYIVKSESAFLRAEQVIYNVIKISKLKHDASFYKKLFYSFLVVFIITIIVVAILIITGVVHEHLGLEYGS